MCVGVGERKGLGLGDKIMDLSCDYAAFISGEPMFLSWCRDLFQRNWEEARPATER